jgi:two-component system, sensor histidine kinase RegB
MGLGIFIAQTLLERTGASLDFANLPDAGAQVSVSWARRDIEAPAADPRSPKKEIVA